MNPGQDENPVGLKNWLAFIAFTLVVVVGWQVLFPPPPPPEPAPGSPPSTAAGEPGSVSDPSRAPGASPPAGEPAGGAGSVANEAIEAGDVERVVVRTPDLIAEITNVGGRVTSWKLPDHPGYWDAEHPVDLVRSPLPENVEGEEPVAPRPVPDDAPVLPLQVYTGDAALDERLASARHAVEVEELAEGQRVSLRWSDGAGTSIEKVLTFREDLPLVVLEARLTVDGRPRAFHVGWGPGVGDHSPAERKNMYFSRGRIVYRAGGEIHREKRPDKADELPAATVDFAGLEDSYFSALFIPGAPDQPGRPALRTGFRAGGSLPPRADGKPGDNDDWPEHVVVLAPFSPGADVQSLYAGPSKRELLKRADALFESRRGLEEVPKLGTFIGPIASFMRTVLIWLHDHVHNWGFAIVCLTLLIRGALFPLTHVSLKKMRLMQDKMKIAKPKIDAIKAKFRKLPRDMQTRQREQQETMEVYRQVGINPADQLLGCLPLLISMPFFFALFRLLQGAPEFRHQGFLGWTDLSAADPTHVWPLLTGLTTFVSQKLSMSQSSGSSEMESMQRNMLIMFPIMFVFFCWQAPLGLVVYWTTNNVVQIGQQYLLKIMLPPPETGDAPESKSKKKKKRTADLNQSESKKDSGGRGKRRRR